MKETQHQIALTELRSSLWYPSPEENFSLSRLRKLSRRSTPSSPNVAWYTRHVLTLEHRHMALRSAWHSLTPWPGIDFPGVLPARCTRKYWPVGSEYWWRDIDQSQSSVHITVPVLIQSQGATGEVKIGAITYLSVGVCLTDNGENEQRVWEDT